MSILEHIAHYLLGEGMDAVTVGFMPQEPARVVTVYASDLRRARDEDGARVQIICRGLSGTTDALADASLVVDALDEFEGILTVDSPFVQRIMLESGPSALGADENNRQTYSINFRVWYCD